MCVCMCVCVSLSVCERKMCKNLLKKNSSTNLINSIYLTKVIKSNFGYLRGQDSKIN